MERTDGGKIIRSFFMNFLFLWRGIHILIDVTDYFDPLWKYALVIK